MCTSRSRNWSRKKEFASEEECLMMDGQETPVWVFVKKTGVPCCNVELSTWTKGLKDIAENADMFQCIQINSLLHSIEDELKVTVPKLTVFYNELIEPQLLKEIPRLRWHLKAAKVSNTEKKNVLDILQYVVEFDFIELLPMVTKSLKLFLAICVSVASCERRFSKLKVNNWSLKVTVYNV